jgi:PAS domain S-box-containing protein
MFGTEAATEGADGGTPANPLIVVAEASSGKVLFSSAPGAPIVGQQLADLAEIDAYAMFHLDGRRYAASEWMLARSLASAEVIEDEEFFRLEDGVPRHYRISSYPVFDSRGRLMAAVAVARDATAEQRVEKERAYHASLLDNVDDAVVGTDPDFRLTVWNRGAERLYGFTAEEVLGRPARDVASYAGDESRLELERRLLETDRTRIEITAYRKDGTPIEVELISAAVRDSGGAVSGYLGIHRDMTSQKRALQERDRRGYQQSLVASLGLRALARGNLQAVLDEAVAAVSEGVAVPLVAIAELLPGRVELVLRAGVGWREGAVGTREAGRQSPVGYAVMTGEPVVSDDVEADPRFEISPFLRGYAPVSAAAVVIAGRRDPFGALGVFSDVNRPFSADDVNFLQTVANVVSTAVERAESDDLILEVRDAERHRMARDLHDQALQDLTDALAQASAGLAGGGAEATDRLARLVPVLKRAGQQVRAAIYDLRMDSEGNRPIGELIEELVNVQRELATRWAIDLDVARNVPARALGSAGTQLLQGVREAIVNARRHSGGQTIRVAVRHADDELSVEVSDDGRGFDVDAQPGSSATGIKGMRERAALLDGDVLVLSTPAGTTVRFSVPLAATPETAVGSTRVLLVEDHAAVREAIAAIFASEADFDVVGQAASLAEARSMLGDVDVAVVDLGLPDGFGGDLIKELREVNPQAQALVLTAGVNRAEIARAIESGAAGTLNKAASLDEVVGAVRRLRAGEMLHPLEEVVELLRLAARERDRERDERMAIESLTRREREVLQLLADGHGSQEIAERLHITLRTERNHVASIFTKLGVHSRLQAVVFALRYDVVVVR